MWRNVAGRTGFSFSQNLLTNHRSRFPGKRRSTDAAPIGNLTGAIAKRGREIFLEAVKIHGHGQPEAQPGGRTPVEAGFTRAGSPHNGFPWHTPSACGQQS